MPVKKSENPATRKMKQRQIRKLAHDGGLPAHYKLTPAEWRVAELKALGMANIEIAEKLHVGIDTVKSYLTNSKVYGKLGVKDSDGLIRYWVDHVEERGECSKCLLRQAHDLGQPSMPITILPAAIAEPKPVTIEEEQPGPYLCEGTTLELIRLAAKETTDFRP